MKAWAHGPPIEQLPFTGRDKAVRRMRAAFGNRLSFWEELIYTRHPWKTP
jgi:hypothetical protein